MTALTHPIREDALDIVNSNEIALEKLSRMSAAFDEMTANAFNFDGSYEAARDRFFAIKGGIRL